MFQLFKIPLLSEISQSIGKTNIKLSSPFWMNSGEVQVKQQLVRTALALVNDLSSVKCLGRSLAEIRGKA